MPARLTALGAGATACAVAGLPEQVREYLGTGPPALPGRMRAGWPRPPGRALWIELEDPPHGATRAAGGAHGARALPRGDLLELVLARCEYHPVVLAPEPEAVAAVRAALAARAA